jgi:hypothetical protein
LKFGGESRRPGKAAAVRHIAKQRFTGWKEGAHGLAPDAN